MNHNEICPLCGRALGDAISKHHLVPKSKKGTDTVTLHNICHQKIHSVFTEKELQKYYHTIPRLLENQEIQAFIEWVVNKPLDFYIVSKDTASRKNKRGRR